MKINHESLGALHTHTHTHTSNFIENKKQNRGITIIVLVIVIVILLILAGISVSMLTGDNGLLGKAGDAKRNTEISNEKEMLEMALVQAVGKNRRGNLEKGELETALSNIVGKNKTSVTDSGTKFKVKFLDSNRHYQVDENGDIWNWEELFETAQAPTEQKKKDVIGIGTDGNPVNMDLWEYTLYNGTYTLNDIDDIEDTQGENGTTENKGYLGEIINGKIQGCVPQYIRTSSDTEFIPVTNMKDTFLRVSDLQTTPEIPDTVTEMQSTFSRCTNLTNITNFPPNLENMQWTFFQCTNLKNVIYIPDSVKNIAGTFWGCKSIEKINNIPNKVQTMRSTFYSCTNLKEIPDIPDGVTDMYRTFYGCTNLKEFNQDIPEGVKDVSYMFWRCENLSNINITIPKGVTNIIQTFYGCYRLSGKININENITGKTLDSGNIDYYGCLYGASRKDGAELKLSGQSPVLEEIITSTKAFNSKSNIIIEN